MSKEPFRWRQRRRKKKRNAIFQMTATVVKNRISPNFGPSSPPPFFSSPILLSPLSPSPPVLLLFVPPVGMVTDARGEMREKESPDAGFPAAHLFAGTRRLPSVCNRISSSLNPTPSPSSSSVPKDLFDLYPLPVPSLTLHLS
ncbi:uncharacterized protein LOC124161126 [Ischnura elegans]|uniref:uncharacterized protein LOC124161126 n=1 Tax=Ischnura elegans TaxID=197161 RepID=UPI001ED86FDA|nr:uncharacterized protein LOC124161126 [Ischnura elegans]